MRRWVWLCGLSVACSSGYTSPGEGPREEAVRAKPGAALEVVARATAGVERTEFAKSAIWDDGKAEVLKYEAERTVYGRAWSFEWTMVHVKEAFDAGAHVKSDQPGQSKTIPVIKTNVMYSMPTYNYPYSMSNGVFVSRDQPFSLVKYVSTSHEWCGITTKKLDLRGELPRLEYDSYFDAERDGAFVLSWPKNGVLEEQLWFAVRTLPFKDGFTMPLSVMSPQLTSHAPRPSWRPGTLAISGPTQGSDASGKARPVWRVKVALEDGGSLVYEVEVGSPHRVVAHTSSAGLKLRLKESGRWAYWNFGERGPLTR